MRTDYTDPRSTQLVLESSLCWHLMVHPGKAMSAMQMARLTTSGLTMPQARQVHDLVVKMHASGGEVGIGPVMMSLDSQEGRRFVAHCAERAVVAGWSVDWVCKDLRRREELASAHRSAAKFADARSGATSAQDVADAAERLVVGPIRHQESATSGAISAVVARRAAGEPPARTVGGWGVANLDTMLGGIRATKQYVVGGRPGQGKTALALQAAANICRAGGAALVCCVEMREQELVDRLVAASASVAFDSIHNHRVRETDMGAVQGALGSIHDWRLHLLCGPHTIEDVAALATSLHLRWGKLDLVVVDHAQNLTPSTTKVRRHEQVGHISRAAQRLSTSLDCATLLLSQLRRDNASDGPRMSDLKESGDLEQDADAIVLIHRPDPRRPEAELRVPKCRFGRLGTVTAAFTGDVMQWA